MSRQLSSTSSSSPKLLPPTFPPVTITTSSATVPVTSPSSTLPPLFLPAPAPPSSSSVPTPSSTVPTLSLPAPAPLSPVPAHSSSPVVPSSSTVTPSSSTIAPSPSAPAPTPSASAPTPSIPSSAFHVASPSTAAPSPAVSTSSVEGTSGSSELRKRRPKEPKACLAQEKGQGKWRFSALKADDPKDTSSGKRKQRDTADEERYAKKPRTTTGSAQKGLRQRAMSRSAAQRADGVAIVGSSSATAGEGAEQDPAGMPEGIPFFQLPQSLSRRTIPRTTTQSSPAPSSRPHPAAQNPVASTSTSRGVGERTSNGAPVASRDASFTSSGTNTSPVPANETYEYNPTSTSPFTPVGSVAPPSVFSSSSPTAPYFPPSTSSTTLSSAAAGPASVPSSIPNAAHSSLVNGAPGSYLQYQPSYTRPTPAPPARGNSISVGYIPINNYQALAGQQSMSGNYAPRHQPQPQSFNAPPVPRAYNPGNGEAFHNYTPQQGQMAHHHRLAPQAPTVPQGGRGIAQGQNVASGSVGNVGAGSALSEQKMREHVNNNPHFQRQSRPQSPFTHPSQQNTAYAQQSRGSHLPPHAQHAAQRHFPQQIPSGQQQHNTGFALPTPRQVQQAVHRVLNRYPGSTLEWEEGIPVVVRPPAAQAPMQGGYLTQGTAAGQGYLPMRGSGVDGMPAGYSTGQQIPPRMGSGHEEPGQPTASTFFAQHAPVQQTPVQRFAPQTDDSRQGYRSMPGYEEGAGIPTGYGMGQQQQQPVASTSYAQPPPAQASGQGGQAWDVDLLQVFSQTQQAGSVEYDAGQQLLLPQPTAISFLPPPAAQASEEVGQAAWDNDLFQHILQTPVVEVPAGHGAGQLRVEEEPTHPAASTSFSLHPPAARDDDDLYS